MSDKRKVELAYPREIDGKSYEPDAVVELPADEAKTMVLDGYARWHEPSSKGSRSSSAKSEG